MNTKPNKYADSIFYARCLVTVIMLANIPNMDYAEHAALFAILVYSNEEAIS